MRTVKYKLASAFLFLFILIFITLYWKERDNSYPLRCSGFTQFELSHQENEVLRFSLTVGLNFQNTENGFMLLNGEMSGTGEHDVRLLNRVIELKKEGMNMPNASNYKISRVKIFPTDTTDTKDFYKLISEFSISPDLIQIELKKLDGGAYLVSGSVSDLFVCIRNE